MGLFFALDILVVIFSSLFLSVVPLSGWFIYSPLILKAIIFAYFIIVCAINSLNLKWK